jgi:hypothetical protein
MRRLILAVAILLTCAAPASARTNRGTYTGFVGKYAVAVVVQAGGVTSYICDGNKTAIWHKGKKLGRLGDLTVEPESRLRLTATYKGKKGSLNYSLDRQHILYRSDVTTASGKRKLAGWILFAKHKQIGAVTSGTTTKSAPSIELETLTAGSFIAGPVTAPGSQQLAVLDTADDGLNVSKRISTSLLGTVQTLALPPASDDDSIVAVDGTALKKEGYTLRSKTGTAITGTTTVTGGLRLTDPSGVTTTATGAMHFLRLLANKDGELDLASGPGIALRLRRDKTDARRDAEAELLAAEAKIRQDNSEIDQAIQEAGEKFAAAMDAARIQMALATIAAGISAAPAGSVTECTQVVVTVANPPPPRKFTLTFCGYPATT